MSVALEETLSLMPRLTQFGILSVQAVHKVFHILGRRGPWLRHKPGIRRMGVVARRDHDCGCRHTMARVEHSESSMREEVVYLLRSLLQQCVGSPPSTTS